MGVGIHDRQAPRSAGGPEGLLPRLMWDILGGKAGAEATGAQHARGGHRDADFSREFTGPAFWISRPMYSRLHNGSTTNSTRFYQ